MNEYFLAEKLPNKNFVFALFLLELRNAINRSDYGDKEKKNNITAK